MQLTFHVQNAFPSHVFGAISSVLDYCPPATKGPECIPIRMDVGWPSGLVIFLAISCICGKNFNLQAHVLCCSGCTRQAGIRELYNSKLGFTAAEDSEINLNYNR